MSSTPSGHSIDRRVDASTLPALLEPAATIVICNYNHGRFLRLAIESALAQNHRCQVIVVDDGSTDDSRSQLAAFASWIEVILQDNAGQLAAYNAGLARATGDIVLFLDADDQLDPEAVSQAAGLFAEGVAKVHFRLLLVDEAGKPTGDCVPSSLASGDVCTALVRHGLLYASAPGSGNVYRRSVLERLFPLPVDLKDRIGADFFTIYGAVAFGRVAACSRVLGRYRVHGRPVGEAQQLVFGNAALGNDEAAKVESRYRRLNAWLAARTAGSIRYADRFLDFSVLKVPYAAAILERPYFAAIAGCGPAWSRLMRSVWLQRDFSLAKRLGLTGWSLVMLLAPRPTALRAARFVCNPANRGT